MRLRLNTQTYKTGYNDVYHCYLRHERLLTKCHTHKSKHNSNVSALFLEAFSMHSRVCLYGPLFRTKNPIDTVNRETKKASYVVMIL